MFDVENDNNLTEFKNFSQICVFERKYLEIKKKVYSDVQKRTKQVFLLKDTK